MSDPNNERLARVETTVDHIRETQQKEERLHAEQTRVNDHNFADIKDGLLHARIGIEKLGGVVDAHNVRLTNLEAKVTVVEDKVDDLSHKFDINKTKVIAWLAGGAAVMTILWAVIDDPIKNLFKYLGLIAFGS
jgi:hypothetical protein